MSEDHLENLNEYLGYEVVLRPDLVYQAAGDDQVLLLNKPPHRTDYLLRRRVATAALDTFSELSGLGDWDRVIIDIRVRVSSVAYVSADNDALFALNISCEKSDRGTRVTRNWMNSVCPRGMAERHKPCWLRNAAHQGVDFAKSAEVLLGLLLKKECDVLGVFLTKRDTDTLLLRHQRICFLHQLNVEGRMVLRFQPCCHPPRIRDLLFPGRRRKLRKRWLAQRVLQPLSQEPSHD